MLIAAMPMGAIISAQPSMCIPGTSRLANQIISPFNTSAPIPNVKTKKGSAILDKNGHIMAFSNPIMATAKIALPHESTLSPGTTCVIRMRPRTSLAQTTRPRPSQSKVRVYHWPSTLSLRKVRTVISGGQLIRSQKVFVPSPRLVYTTILPT